MEPTAGRIVNYIMENGDVRPAMIVRVWNVTCVNLQVFIDGTNDGAQPNQGTLWKTSVCEGTAPNTWQWPQRK